MAKIELELRSLNLFYSTVLPPSSENIHNLKCVDIPASISKRDLNLSSFPGTFHREILTQPECLYKVPPLHLRSAGM